MGRVLVWNTMGDILETFDSVDDAEEWIEDGEHEELTRTQNGADTNIAVMESF